MCKLGHSGRRLGPVILRARQDRIVSALRSGGAASVRDLAQSLAVSESTIRRDLDILDRNGELTRTYGGAVLRPGETVTDSGDPRRMEGPFSADAGARGGGLRRVVQAFAGRRGESGRGGIPAGRPDRAVISTRRRPPRTARVGPVVG